MEINRNFIGRLKIEHKLFNRLSLWLEAMFMSNYYSKRKWSNYYPPNPAVEMWMRTIATKKLQFSKQHQNRLNSPRMKVNIHVINLFILAHNIIIIITLHRMFLMH